MKIEDVKHNHSLTDLLKILLFAILMLAPIGSVAVRCLYVICNKNAYQSYSQTSDIENISSLGLNYGETYHFANEITSSLFSDGAKTIYIDNFNGFKGDGFNATDIDNINNYGINQLYFANNGSTNAYLQLRVDATTKNTINLSNKVVSFDFEFINANGNDESLLNSMIYQTTDNQYSKLDNVFEYSVSQLENDQLFSWTANTPVYTGINAMCTQLGITGQAIPIILSYWLILTCIYVVIDIVIKLFTLLTHMISRKSS